MLHTTEAHNPFQDVIIVFCWLQDSWQERVEKTKVPSSSTCLFLDLQRAAAHEQVQRFQVRGRKKKKKKFHSNEVVLVINATKTDLVPCQNKRRHCHQPREGRKYGCFGFFLFVISVTCCYCLHRYAVKKAESSFCCRNQISQCVYIFFPWHGCFCLVFAFFFKKKQQQKKQIQAVIQYWKWC